MPATQLASDLMCTQSQVDVDDPDLERFPGFAEAQGLSCTLSPGEALHIPKRWWHHVRAETLSLSVSWWWT